MSIKQGVIDTGKDHKSVASEVLCAKNEVKKRRITKKDKLIAKLPEIIKGKSMMQAGIEVGYSPGARNMYRHIKTQLKDLISVNKDSLLREWEELKNICLQAGDMTNVARCLEHKGRLTGQYVDKQEVTHNEAIDLNMSQAQLRQQLTEALNKLEV